MDDGQASPGAFAALLRRLRTQAALTQEELAARAGVTAKAIGALERGERRRPYPHTVRSLADALAVDDAQRMALAAAARPDSARAAGAERRPSRPLVGREAELSELVELVRAGTTRLLTLTGPGGVGKTSLALALADELEGDIGPAVVIELAAVRDKRLVLPAIARSLEIRQGGTPVLESLAGAIGDRRLVLVLDNLEHLLDVAPDVADLLADCPGLVVLATSRAALRVGAELERPIPPLSLPVGNDPAAVSGSAAGAVFLERARAAGGEVWLDEQTAPAIAAICRRVEGLPLALELAAAHARFLSPQDLVSRLDDAVSSPRSRDRPERHRTLRATLDWSYDLLTAEEQLLLQRLAVFVGGFDLAAAELVFDADVLGPLGGLVEQSLVVFERDRYRLLEPVRQYAAARLVAAGESGQVASRAAEYFCDLATVAHAGLHSAEQGDWLDLLQREHGNLDATLQHLVAAVHADGPARAARLGASIWLYWALRASAVEALDQLQRVRIGDLDASGRAALHLALAALRYATGDPLAMAEPANAAVEEARSAAPHLLTEALILAGYAGVAVGAETGAELAEALHRAADAGDGWATAHAGAAEGQRLLRAGEHAASAAAFAEAEQAARALGNPFALSTVLNGQATLARATGDDRRALECFTEAVALAVGIGTTWTLAYSLPVIATVAAARGELELAAELFAAGAQAASVAVAYPPGSPGTPTSLAVIRDQLGDLAFQQAWHRGRSYRPDELPSVVAAVSRRVARG